MMNRMKKTMKRTLATVLTLAMVLAMLPAGPVRVFAVATQLTDPNLQYFTGDDFNNREAFKANWNIDPATVPDQWNISDKYPTGWDCVSKAEDLKTALATVGGYDANTKYFDEREGTGNTFLAFRNFNNNLPNNKSATPVKWTTGNKPLEYEFDFRAPISNLTTGEFSSVSIPLAMSGENNADYFCISVGSPDSGHKYKSHLSIMPYVTSNVVKTSGFGGNGDNGYKLIVPAWGYGNNVVKASGYSWTHIKAVYDYSQWTDAAKTVAITVTATVVKTTTENKGTPNLAGTETYTNTRTYTVTFPEGTKTITIGFVPGTSAGHINIDDLTVKSTAQEAQEFYDTYNDFLSRDPEAMTNSDFDAFTAMYNAWAVLDDQSKAMLAGSGINQDLVDSFVAVFASLCGNLTRDGFESAFKTEQWWNNVDGTVAKLADTYQNASNATVATDNSFLKITSASNATGKWVTPKNWAKGERPTKLSFKFRREYGNSGTAYLYFAYDPVNSYGAGLQEWNDGGTNQPTIRARTTTSANSGYSPSDNGAKILSHQYAHNNYVTTYDQWITIEAVYDWSTFDTDGKLKITYSIPKIGGEQVSLKDQTITYTFAKYGANAPTLYPAFYTDGSSFDIDDVVIETNAKAANAYKETYGEFLAKESVTEADLNNYLAAYDAYNAVDASAKAFLTAEKAKLDAFKSQFDALYAGQKLSDIDFDSGFIADQFFETTGGSVSYGDSKVTIPSGVSYALKSGRLEGEPQSMSFNFCYPQGSSKLVLFTEGEKTAYIDFGGPLIQVGANSGITLNPSGNGAKLLSCENNMNIDYVDRNLDKAAVWDTSKMITLTANYDYSQWDRNIIKVSFDIKFWGYNFDFGADKKPVDMNNANGTYTPGWVEHKNIQTFTFTFSDVGNVKFEPKFVSSGTTQVDSISVTYRDAAMEDLLNRINSLVITPATFDDLEALAQQYANSGKTNANIESALAEKQAEADALHPATLGGTIKTTNNVRKQNLKILAAAPTALAPDGFRVSRIGVLFLPANMLNGELTVDTPSVANGSLAVTSVPAQFSGELTNSALDATRCGMEFATRCYVVYTDGTNDYIVYGETITRSIYGIAREIANAVLAKALSDAGYSATVTYTNAVPNGTANVDNVANEDVLAFITGNVSAVSALSQQ